MKRVAAVVLILLFITGVCLRFVPVEPRGTQAGMLMAIVVEDSAHRTPQIGAVLTDRDVLEYVAQKHIQWRVVDRAESGPDSKDVQFALQAAVNCRLPALVLRAGAGKPHVCALPAAAKDLLSLLKSAG